jgi:tetratricopeptide (TPR) repeat protein
MAQSDPDKQDRPKQKDRRQRPVVVISSTARDLPEHRRQVMDAVSRASCTQHWMETLPATPDDAVTASMKLVDDADIYVGIFAHRYGCVPAGSEISITEMEYHRAIARGIPCLLFLIDDKHPITIDMVEQGPAVEKLKEFKKRVGDLHVVGFFKSSEELRTLVLHALQEARKKWEREGEDDDAQPRPISFHYVHPIPRPPEPYIAHYYSLLQTGKLIGRRPELDLLTQWITKSSSPMMHAVAIGGMGKSALTWHWFNQIAPQEWPRMKGRLWWSFYESDGHFENFVTRSLAYVSGQSEEEVRKLSLYDRCQTLLRHLSNEPYLLVLDGLERVLTAYARHDAAYVQDHELDDQTANAIADSRGLPQGFYQSAVLRHPLRLAADPGVGRFLRALAQVRQSRILTSSRLFPADLQLPNGQPMPGCGYLFLQGLSESDSLELWREYGARGSREVMLPIFNNFGRHPLVLKVFAGKVANDRLHPGDFDAWHKANPDFKPYGELVSVQTHILEHALRDLSLGEGQALNIIAGFRMPAGIETLHALLIKPPPGDAPADGDAEADEEDADPASERLNAPFATLGELDAALTLLEDRGLLGWDRAANRYDLHPIVRGVVWDLLRTEHKQAVGETLRSHFAAVPAKEYEDIESLDDLTPAIELYDKLISLGRYDDAYNAFRDRLGAATLYRLSAARLRIALAERLFPDGTDHLPCIDGARGQSYMLNALALGYALSGRPGKAAGFYERLAEIERAAKDDRNLAVSLLNASDAITLAGQLRRAETAASEALILCRKSSDDFSEAVGLEFYGRACGFRGEIANNRRALVRSRANFKARNATQSEGVVEAYLSEGELAAGNLAAAKAHAERAWQLAPDQRVGADFIRAARLQGTAALHLGDFTRAGERLQEALTRVRACDFVEEELPTLIAIAELHRQQNDTAQARQFLDEVWEKCEQGPYPIFHADAFNVLAQIERDADARDKAIAAATQAYQKAWCDGPPYAYHWGLEKAKKHLAELGAALPEMPAFDASKFPPMPEVEINPRDEYYVEMEDEAET